MDKGMKLIVGVVIVLVVAVSGLIYSSGIPIMSSEPILIESDQDFEEQDWSGSGTEFDPYLISGKTIFATVDSFCIEIHSTTVFFVIEDCHLESTTGMASLKLEDVRNAEIKDCTFVSRSQGIYMVNVSESLITNNSFEGQSAGDEIMSQESIASFQGESVNFTWNQVKNCRMSAMWLGDMSNCLVADNTLSNSLHGVALMECSSIEISRNEIMNSGNRGCGTPSYDGIIAWRSVGLIIDDNDIHDNDGHGIRFSWSSDCSISGCTIEGNALGGIFTNNSDYISVSDCTIANNDDDGIECDRADTFTVETSHIHHNSGSGVHFSRIENGNINDNQIEFNLLWGILISDCLATEESNNSFDSNSLGDVREE